LMTTW